MKDRLKVLYVEDNKADFHIISILLKKSEAINFELEWAPTPEEFYEKCQDESYDAFIVDYMLGPVNGLDMIKNSKIAINKPIILLTAYASDDLDKEALDAGISFFINKDSVSDHWQILDKALRYCLSQSKRLYNSAKIGLDIKTSDEINKLEKIFSFDYTNTMKAS